MFLFQWKHACDIQDACTIMLNIHTTEIKNKLVSEVC